LNPGLGFRPQIDPEDHVINFHPLVYNEDNKGSLKYTRNLELFRR
jgi:hypothetical protein